METKELLPGTLEMLILKTLSRGPNHGYGIAQHIQWVSADTLKIGEGSLYPALQRLLVNTGFMRSGESRIATARPVSTNSRRLAASAWPRNAEPLTP
jgi:PadR family transcriptional regulator, regulatory protein PadR